jgi:hypothetical protein
VLVENSATSLTCGFTPEMISVRARLPGLPAAGHGAVLAGFACPLLGVQGRGNTRAPARGVDPAPGESEADNDVAGSRRARGARPPVAESAARAPDCDAGHAAALAQKGVAAKWRQPKPPGRPPISDEVEALVLVWPGRTAGGVSYASRASCAGSATRSRPPPSAESCDRTGSHRPRTGTTHGVRSSGRMRRPCWPLTFPHRRRRHADPALRRVRHRTRHPPGAPARDH